MSDFVYTKVDPKRLGTVSGEIDSSLHILENAFKDVEDTLHTVLRPMWTGPACDDFFKQFTVDAQIFSTHTKALKSMNNQLKEASGVYDKADDMAEDLVRELKIG